ncbi:MAG: GYD domain-containing protein [Gemmatimonadota bacterium]|nr:GYD domain-containing protein [Gemmatimonadota bacterium]MDH4349157.1 GYD domain-containing protein [Gemmatimonadota bacterium]MDH5283464.1 GYD domain-containing protein [Gemmatimonadota bacterium]
MPFYLWQGSYNTSGVQGLQKDGGSKRAQMVRGMIEKVGGKLHAFYYCFGDSDVIGIAEFPDHATAVAVSLAVNASGAVSLKSTVLLTPEDVDKATKMQVGYKAPGS